MTSQARGQVMASESQQNLSPPGALPRPKATAAAGHHWALTHPAWLSFVGNPGSGRWHHSSPEPGAPPGQTLLGHWHRTGGDRTVTVNPRQRPWSHGRPQGFRRPSRGVVPGADCRMVSCPNRLQRTKDTTLCPQIHGVPSTVTEPEPLTS